MIVFLIQFSHHKCLRFPQLTFLIILSLSRIPRNYKFSLSSRWFLTLDLHVCHATHTRLSIQNCAICSSFNTQRQATASHSTISKWNELEVEMERKSVKWEKDNGRAEEEEVCCVVRVFELEPNLMLPNLITKKCRRVFLFAFFFFLFTRSIIAIIIISRKK